MKPRSDKLDLPDVGVIVGRFQVPYLHEEHCDLIDTVVKRHMRTLVFLGLSEARVTKNNPLDFQSRLAMFKAEFPEVEVHFVHDVPGNNAAWSERLDAQIKGLVPPTQTVMLYGGRDSFIRDPRTDEPIYSGRYPTTELEPEDGHYADVSGTTLRKRASKEMRGTEDFRWGVCWAAANQYAKCMPTVDVAVFNETGTKILLARKEHEDGWRFIGGFAEPMSPSFEHDAKREVEEEAGIIVSEPEYLFSSFVDDPRYDGEVDKIKTLMFLAQYESGTVQAADDVKEVRWFDWEPFGKTTWQDRDPLFSIVPTHQPLMKQLRQHFAGNPVFPTPTPA